jgi:PTS system nitrogen regulatory IIA component
MDIGEWLGRASIGYRVSPNSKRQALAVAAELAARSLGVDATEVLDALLAREQESSTGVGHGVALPHARVRGLDRMRAVFLRFNDPVEFEAVDDQPVDLLFALFAPPDATTEHLRALARVSRLLRQRQLRESLRQARSADALYAVLVAQASTNAA